MEEDSIPRVFGQAAWTILKGILACFYLPVATAIAWIVIHYVL